MEYKIVKICPSKKNIFRSLFFLEFTEKVGMTTLSKNGGQKLLTGIEEAIIFKKQKYQ